jgi:hypothetical protein
MIDPREIVAAMARRAQLEQAPDFTRHPGEYYLIGSSSACRRMSRLADDATRLDALLIAVAELAEVRHVRDDAEQAAALVRALDRVREVADTWREVL